MRSLALLAFAALPSLAVAAPLDLDVVDYTLPNGLRVVLSPEHRAPTVGVAVFYDVGSRDEAVGKTGLAHLVEHFMFQGSKNLGPGDFLKLVHEAGGEADGVTFPDHSVFFEEVPSGWLERLLWAEADRMAGPELDEELLARELRHVTGERAAHEGTVYEPATERLAELAFGKQAVRPVGGAPQDLAGITLADVRDFWQKHYGPGRATLAIAGDFDEKTARTWIEKYFGALARRDLVPPAAAPAPIPPGKQEIDRVRDPLAQTPALLVAYRAPEAHAADWYALDLVGAVLGAGESSRLTERLVDDKRVAVAVTAGIDLDYLRGPGLLGVELHVAPGHTLDEARSLLDAAIAEVAAKGPTQRELDKAKHRARAHLAAALATNEGRAERLAEWASLWGDPRKLRDEADRYDAVKLADVKAAAQRYLAPENRVLVEVLPPEAPPANPKAPSPTEVPPRTEQKGPPVITPSQPSQGGK